MTGGTIGEDTFISFLYYLKYTNDGSVIAYQSDISSVRRKHHDETVV